MVLFYIIYQCLHLTDFFCLKTTLSCFFSHYIQSYTQPAWLYTLILLKPFQLITTWPYEPNKVGLSTAKSITNYNLMCSMVNEKNCWDKEKSCLSLKTRSPVLSGKQIIHVGAAYLLYWVFSFFLLALVWLVHLDPCNKDPREFNNIQPCPLQMFPGLRFE